jgi:hypothetical protein
MLIKIYADKRLLKPGETIVIQKRSANEVTIEELFRWTFPTDDFGFGHQATLRSIEIKGLDETAETLI